MGFRGGALVGVSMGAFVRVWGGEPLEAGDMFWHKARLLRLSTKKHFTTFPGGGKCPSPPCPCLGAPICKLIKSENGHKISEIGPMGERD